MSRLPVYNFKCATCGMSKGKKNFQPSSVKRKIGCSPDGLDLNRCQWYQTNKRNNRLCFNCFKIKKFLALCVCGEFYDPKCPGHVHEEPEVFVGNQENIENMDVEVEEKSDTWFAEISDSTLDFEEQSIRVDSPQSFWVDPPENLSENFIMNKISIEPPLEPSSEGESDSGVVMLERILDRMPVMELTHNEESEEDYTDRLYSLFQKKKRRISDNKFF